VIALEPSRIRHARGFSLVELMVVIVLISIMTALIVPEMRGTFADATLRSGARKLVDALTLANSRAVSLGQVHRVRFDEANGKYVLERGARSGERAFVEVDDVSTAKGALDDSVKLQIRKTDLADAPDLAPLIHEAEPQSRQTISFYADGSADGADILLRDRHGFELRLNISRITGRIEVMERGHE
jgi:type II secretion system protein H